MAETDLPTYEITPRFGTYVLEERQEGQPPIPIGTGRVVIDLAGKASIIWIFDNRYLGADDLEYLLENVIKPFDATNPGVVQIEEPPTEWPGFDPEVTDTSVLVEIWEAGRDAAIKAFNKSLVEFRG